jgi:hypothetical protein
MAPAHAVVSFFGASMVQQQWLLVGMGGLLLRSHRAGHGDGLRRHSRKATAMPMGVVTSLGHGHGGYHVFLFSGARETLSPGHRTRRRRCHDGVIFLKTLSRLLAKGAIFWSVGVARCCSQKMTKTTTYVTIVSHS